MPPRTVEDLAWSLMEVIADGDVPTAHARIVSRLNAFAKEEREKIAVEADAVAVRCGSSTASVSARVVAMAALHAFADEIRHIGDEE
jgi:hypothetical protein